MYARRALLITIFMALSSRGAVAKDWGDVLLEKGLITPEELEQTRKEIEQSNRTEKKEEPPPTPAAAVSVPPPTEANQPSATNPPPAEASRLSALVKQFHLSTLIYADWSYYSQTSFAPQFLTQINPPGPGNDGYNSFDLTRTYLNLVWKPSDRFTLRVTPNIYREIAPSGTVSTSQGSSTSTNLNGNLTFRLKYAFLQVNDLFKGLSIKIGQFENPLIPWEEDLYGYRFVNLVPLNFFAYSSTDLGIAAFGPVTIHGVQYADYWFGVYNGSSFHAAELNEKRSPQGRISLYPFADNPDLAGLGITGFFSYGYTNVAPDTKDAVIKRLAGLVHYTGKHFGLAFEIDQTRNQNSISNFFSASGPNPTIPDPNNPGATLPNPIYQLYSSILNPDAPGRGYSVFGHVDLGTLPFSLFGMWTRWYPNNDVHQDPLDSDRFVGGIAYKITDWLRVAADGQNFVYFRHGPAVPPDVNAFFTNLEINY